MRHGLLRFRAPKVLLYDERIAIVHTSTTLKPVRLLHRHKAIIDIRVGRKFMCDWKLVRIEEIREK